MKLKRFDTLVKVGEEIELPEQAVVIATTSTYIIIQDKDADLLVIHFG